MRIAAFILSLVLLTYYAVGFFALRDYPVVLHTIPSGFRGIGDVRFQPDGVPLQRNNGRYEIVFDTNGLAVLHPAWEAFLDSGISVEVAYSDGGPISPVPTWSGPISTGRCCG